MPREDKIGGVAGISYDAVTASHYAVIEILEWTVSAVGPVIGRDKRSAGLSRGKERTPSRRPASGMQEFNPSLLDKPRQPPRIGKDSNGILACHGKQDYLAAGPLKPWYHAATFRCNECEGTGPGERFGNFESCLLATSSIDSRYNL
jgi:hypothetical protein